MVDWCEPYTECSSTIQWISRSCEQSLPKCLARYLRAVLEVTDNNAVETMEVICESIQTMLGDVQTFSHQHLWCSRVELDKYICNMFRQILQQTTLNHFLRHKRQWSQQCPISCTNCSKFISTIFFLNIFVCCVIC